MRHERGQPEWKQRERGEKWASMMTMRTTGGESRAGEITEGLGWSLSLIVTGYRPGLMYDTQYDASPACCHLLSCMMWVCWTAACHVWHVCSVCTASLCSVFIILWFSSLLLRNLKKRRKKSTLVLNISLTSIHPIQLPHPWMQWLWPYQWEILTTQKVGQIKNPTLSVCLSLLHTDWFGRNFSFHFMLNSQWDQDPLL